MFVRKGLDHSFSFMDTFIWTEFHLSILIIFVCPLSCLSLMGFIYSKSVLEISKPFSSPNNPSHSRLHAKWVAVQNNGSGYAAHGPLNMLPTSFPPWTFF